MKQDLLLVLDAGTSGVKCSLFDEKCALVDSTRADYGTVFPRPGWSEQPMEDIWAACCRAAGELLGRTDPKRVACVGLSGTMNGCVPVDEAGQALHPNIIHSDSRAVKELEEIRAVISPEDFYRLTGNRLDNHYTLPKILWLKEHEPEVYRRARWFLNIKDYLYGRLTGRFGFTDYSDASLTIALDINRRAWAGELLKELDLDVGRMPVILKGHDVEGRVTEEVSRACGLIAGTPVAIGGGDGACTTRGAGVSEPGSAYCYIGSSAWVAQLLDHPLLDPKARIFNWLDMNGEDYHVCGTVQCGAAAYDWALQNLLGGQDGSADISAVEEMARGIAPGAEGVMFLPTLMGWRTPYWDPNTRGCLMGFSLYHDRRHIARAVYEGIAFALNSCAEVMAECDAPVRSLMLTGGGALSGLWPDMIASIFGVTAQVHRTPGETTSLGAAIAAGVGVGLFNSYADAAGMVSARSTHPVDPRWQEAYRKVYAIWSDIYGQIRPLNDRIAGL